MSTAATENVSNVPAPVANEAVKDVKEPVAEPTATERPRCC